MDRVATQSVTSPDADATHTVEISIRLNEKKAEDSTSAEFVAAQESEVTLKPLPLDFVQAAAIPVGAWTAWQAIFDIARLAPGQKILIHVAASGVGSMAVQLAKAKGAYVIGNASARNADFLRELGLDEVIDYQTTKGHLEK